jgi:hypothetical protein
MSCVPTYLNNFVVTPSTVQLREFSYSSFFLHCILFFKIWLLFIVGGCRVMYCYTFSKKYYFLSSPRQFSSFRIVHTVRFGFDLVCPVLMFLVVQHRWNLLDKVVIIRRGGRKSMERSGRFFVIGKS